MSEGAAAEKAKAEAGALIDVRLHVGGSFAGSVPHVLRGKRVSRVGQGLIGWLVRREWVALLKKEIGAWRRILQV